MPLGASRISRKNSWLTPKKGNCLNFTALSGGQMVRIFVKDIREAGRNTQGVKLINLREGDKLQAIAPVISEQQEDAAVGQEEAK